MAEWYQCHYDLQQAVCTIRHTSIPTWNSDERLETTSYIHRVQARLYSNSSQDCFAPQWQSCYLGHSPVSPLRYRSFTESITEPSSKMHHNPVAHQTKHSFYFSFIQSLVETFTQTKTENLSKEWKETPSIKACLVLLTLLQHCSLTCFTVLWQIDKATK